MPLTQGDKLRQLLGEQLPDGGTAADTLFTDDEIAELLSGISEGDEEGMERAAYAGWRVKAAKLSNLVDTTEGNVSRKFSQLLDNALDMLKTYSRASGGATEGRTRVGRARRAGVEW